MVLRIKDISFIGIYINDSFRDFKDINDYANYHVSLLNNKRYNAFTGDFIDRVVKGGYATDPNYKRALSNVYNQIAKAKQGGVLKAQDGDSLKRSEELLIKKALEFGQKTSEKIQPYDIRLIDFIKRKEGFRSKPEKDKTDGKLTVGYGLTDPKLIRKYENGITEEEASKYLVQHLQMGADSLATMPYYNNLNLGEKTALNDLIYNVGWNKFKNSKRLQSHLRKGNDSGAKKEMNHGEHQARGLRIRRNQNRQMYDNTFNWKYDEGGILKYQNPSSGIKYMGGYDKRGNMVLPVTNENGMNNVTLPEVTVTPRNINLAGAVDRGKRKFLKTTGELATPVLTGAGIAGLGYGLATATIPTLVGLGTSYAGTKVGESIDNKTDNNTNYKTMGGLIGGAIGGLGANMTPKLIAGDAYTTVGGKFGYYGNPLQRFTGTVGRRLNLNTKARNPELLRKISEPAPINSNGTIQVSNPTPRTNFARTNFTTDRPVVSHSAGNWDHMDLNIFDPKITKGLKPASIEPSDTFYPFANITAKPSQTTLVSGNKSALVNAQDKGMSTLSSPKLRQIYEDMQAEYLGNLTKYSKMTPMQRRMVKTNFEDNVSPKLKKAYAEEIQRLQSQRGTPTIRDYKKVENDTGLDAGVTTENLQHQFAAHVDKLKNTKISDYNDYASLDFVYPNGRIVKPSRTSISGETRTLNNMPYNKVFYDPASHVEFNWATKNGFKTN